MVIVGNMDITGEDAQTISKQYNNTVTGVELVCVTLTKQTVDPRLINRSETSLCDANKTNYRSPFNRSGTSLCDTNKTQNYQSPFNRSGTSLCDANKTNYQSPFNRSGTSLCDANKTQTIDPRFIGVELVCVTLTKHKLSIPV